MQKPISPELKLRLRKEGFQILDLGTDFEAIDHLYFLIRTRRGKPESDRLLSAKELDEFLQRL